MQDETNSTDFENTANVAGKYAWEYFKYHAGQRQAVFRFYLTLIAAATLAYGYSKRGSASVPVTDAREIEFIVGAIYLIASFLFWRLDKRSQRLIKNAETALKAVESRLATSLNDERIKLMQIGDQKTAKFPISYFESFRQIYGWIFCLIAVAGVYFISRAI